MNYNEKIDRLGFNRHNGLYLFAENKWKNKFSRRVEEVIEQKIKPHALYEFNGEPFALFFEKRQEKEVHKWCWNLNSSPLIFINEENQLKIYNGFSYDNKRKFLELLLESEREIGDLNYINLVSGKFLEKYGNKFNESTRVDYRLLENIAAARNILIDQYRLKASIVNGLIGRILFLRYLVDRKVKIGHYGHLSNGGLLEILARREKTYGLFNYLRTAFNGNLFPIDEENESMITGVHLDVLARLLKGDELETGQMNLFQAYDFSVIPIEFVSNIYECFLGEGGQKEQGAYYTPPFLVDYILKETVDPYFKKEGGGFQCKVLDPACGSGIFLVETLRRLIHRYREVTTDWKADRQKYQAGLKNLLCDNIFGIDKDRNAIEVAIFSLYITLLDYQEPKDIEDFKFPRLIGRNFFPVDFFDLQADFNQKIKNIRFDFIVGNPPWGNPAKKERKKKNPGYVEYCKNRKIKIGENEISQAFLARTGDFAEENTCCSLVVTSKNLYNIGSLQFRRYFLETFRVNRIFELSSVRRQLFKKYVKTGSGAIAPAAVLFYSHAREKNTDANPVKHISLKPNRIFNLFKIFIIEKYDYKEILQKYFKQYDWLFKVLVYGNVPDFHFIKRLKENYPRIGETIDDPDRFIVGRGVSIKGGDNNHADFLMGRHYVDTKKKMLQPFRVDLDEDARWGHPVVHRPRNKDLYLPPMLLVKKGTGSDHKVISAVCDDAVAFTDSITSIKSYNRDDRRILQVLSGLFYSDLFAYYNISTGSSAGIEREQSHDRREKFSFPYTDDKKILEKVTAIEENRSAQSAAARKMKKQIVPSGMQKHMQALDSEFARLQKELNSEICRAFALSGQEKALVDYVEEIVIPLVRGGENQWLFKEAPDPLVEAYARLFVDGFEAYFSASGEYFSATITRNTYLIGINFEITKEKPRCTIRWTNGQDTRDKNNRDNMQIFEKLVNLSFSEISDDIFIRKDVKGFDENSFYVIKPNQYRLWHQATAYLDLNEFSDAILEAGKKQLVEDAEGR